MSLFATLSSRFGDAFEALGVDRSHGQVVVSARPDLGQFQCNGALAAAREARRNPRDLATAVVASLQDDPLIESLSIAGPGFINVSVTGEALAAELARMAADERLGYPVVETPERVIIDFGGANAAKEMAVHHLRASIIGDSLQRLFRFRGDDVVSDIHMGDWGLQMGQLLAEIEHRMPELPYFDADFSGPYPTEPPVTMEDLGEIYPASSARLKTEPEFRDRARRATTALQNGRPGYRALWQHLLDISIAALKRDYISLGGIEFDLWFGESTVHDRVAPMLDRLDQAGLLEESDGATVMDVSSPDDRKEMPPLLLVTGHGAYLYGTSDLATIDLRVQEYDAERILYVVDQRQAHHFEQVFRAARRSGIAGDAALEHLGFGTMNGADGRPFKTRAGGLLRLHDLIQMVVEQARQRLDEIESERDYDDDEAAGIAQQVGIATLKYADLSNHRVSDYTFDLEKFSSFEGRTGPYLLYSAVRIKSILRKAADLGLAPGALLPPEAGPEQELSLILVQLHDLLDRTIEQRAPNLLAEYAFNVAVAFNRFYNHCHILTEEDPARQASWLALSALTLDILALATDLLGIAIPARM